MKGRIGLGVFFGIFLLIGGFALYFILIRPALGIAAARQWVETPCRIDSSKVGVHDSDDGHTYSVDIEYSYTFDRQTYQSKRYDFFGGSSSGRRAKEVIVGRYPIGSEAICYVDPRNPREAVLERRWTAQAWWAFIPLVFVLVGAAGLGWVVFGRSDTSPVAAASDAPWSRRPDWAAGQIKSSNKSTMIGAWVFAGLWNSISWIIAIVFQTAAREEGTHDAWFVWFFPAIGIALLVWAIRATARWRKFGEATLELAGPCGAIGGVLAGRLQLGRFVQPDDGFRLTLRCVRRVTTGSGKNRSTHESELWQTEQRVAGGTDTMAVQFYIPPDCEESSDENPNSRVIWRLDVKAKVPGVDYLAQFEVPVFRVALTPEQVALAEQVRAAGQQSG